MVNKGDIPYILGSRGKGPPGPRGSGFVGQEAVVLGQMSVHSRVILHHLSDIWPELELELYDATACAVVTGPQRQAALAIATLNSIRTARGEPPLT